MTDYNDGNWYGWDGGECPVHPDHKCDTLWPDGARKVNSKASHLNWSLPFLFRVTKPYVEPKKPREFWVYPTVDGLNVSCREIMPESWMGWKPIHVREVLE